MPGPMGGPGRGPVVAPNVKDFKKTTKKLIKNYKRVTIFPVHTSYKSVPRISSLLSIYHCMILASKVLWKTILSN